ncbi:hypothetical protein [Mucilaginibacter psychrotolerans]|uniref:DUF2244 domain-containing protein n=1 Tax=Mucilaginibacter psychrotolerans TaxID=1524096 RepID=A0A4Y8SGN4_9SPHI|nr:hypothetical protein [Mucilaginibacter psychrotolerans]TFF38022.1 hypothetical protein E2R66_10590 [Mucilaginibacter psychrotolerans]
MHLFTPKIIVCNPVPQETRIIYSKDDALVKAIGLFIFLSFGIPFLYIRSYWFGLPFCLFAAYHLYLKGKICLNDSPQIVINLEGMRANNAPFYEWEEIHDVRISGELLGRGARPCLEYKYPGGKVKLRVEHLNISPLDLSILLAYYQKPWEFKGNSK